MNLTMANPQQVVSSTAAAQVSMNPTQVTTAVSNPHFYQNKESFWQMLCYLFSDYQSQKVHTFLPPDTFRNISVQLYSLIESVDVDKFHIIQSNAKLLYHTYFLLLKNIRAQKTITWMLAKESPEEQWPDSLWPRRPNDQDCTCWPARFPRGQTLASKSCCPGRGTFSCDKTQCLSSI